jgi:hypothetical protein
MININSNKNIILSIIIINYKTPTLLKQCIQSIQKNKPNFGYEIIAIDNNSEDISAEMVRDDFEDSVVLIANKENLGFPRAVNQGVKKSKASKYILVLNPDITVIQNCLDRMYQYMEENKKIAVLGPKLLNPNGSIQYSCFSQYPSLKMVLYRRTVLGKTENAKKKINKFLMTNWDHKQESEVAWILGSCMFIRKEAIKKVGLMDERFFMYMEDVDWCRRFWNNNYKVVYSPKFEMVHYYQRASASEPSILKSIFNKITRIHIASAIKFFFKYWRHKDKNFPNFNINLNKNNAPETNNQ